MDALDLLEEQHRELSALFAQAAEAGTPGRRSALVVQLVRAIEAHSRVEEGVFYAAFTARVSADEARLWESFEGHALLRFAAQNLLATRATDVRFAARFNLLRDLFARHAHAEEDWMFPKAKRALHDEVLDRIGADIARAHAARVAVTASVPPYVGGRRRQVETRRRAIAAPA